MGSIEDTASRMVAGPGRERPLGSAYLLILEDGSSRIVPLPRDGSLVIGRTSEVDVQIDHPTVTRRHATVRSDGGAMRIADLGSRNGTKVNGEKVEQATTLSSGDVVLVGDVVIVVHGTMPIVSRSALGEAAWRRRLAEEIDRAVTYHRSLAVLTLVGVSPAVVAELGDVLRLIDVIGEGERGSAWLLMPEVDREQARAIAAAVVHRISPPVRAGLAVCPSDACDVDTIMLAGRKAAAKAAPGTFAETGDAASEIELGDRSVLVLDPAMSRVYDLIKRLATSTLPMLILGEPGVGKENAAYAVHYWSKRNGPFVVVNCAELTESLAESALFGHEKGAFTGAMAAKAGFFEAANGGTLFLDEVGELSTAVQSKLLRVLENKTITRVGDTKARPVDVRLVAATNRNLDAMIAEGRFRNDLKGRLDGATVILPPLRDRRCEVAMLARRFLDDACKRAEKKPLVLTPAAMQVLLTYAWPNNVRELRNAMEFASTAPDDRVEVCDLPDKLVAAIDPTTLPAPAKNTGEIPAVGAEGFRPIADELRDLEKQRMVEALAAANSVKTKAAQLIGMPIRTFTLKAKQYGL